MPRAGQQQAQTQIFIRENALAQLGQVDSANLECQKAASESRIEDQVLDRANKQRAAHDSAMSRERVCQRNKRSAGNVAVQNTQLHMLLGRG